MSSLVCRFSFINAEWLCLPYLPSFLRQEECTRLQGVSSPALPPLLLRSSASITDSIVFSVSIPCAGSERPAYYRHMYCTDKNYVSDRRFIGVQGEPSGLQYELAVLDDLFSEVPVLGDFQADLRHQFARFPSFTRFLINYRDFHIDRYKAHKPHRLLLSLEVTVGSFWHSKTL